MAAAAPDPAPALIVRRARWHVGAQFAVAILFAGIAGVVLVERIGSGEFLTTAALFAALMGVLLWQTAGQFFDRTPVAVVDRVGLTLPAALPEAIPWSRIRRAVPVARLLSAPRVEIDVDGETFVGLKLGQRFLGDFIVGRRGASNGFSLLTKGLDADAKTIFAAIGRYWPLDDEGRGE